MMMMGRTVSSILDIRQSSTFLVTAPPQQQQQSSAATVAGILLLQVFCLLIPVSGNEFFV